jgi:SAM-dependent methyltransferase
MSDATRDTSERVTPGRQVSLRQHVLYLRHLFAYEFAKSQIPRQARVVEVGCGDGYGADILSRHIDRMVGLDVNDRVVQRATKRYASENCSFRAYDGVRIPFPDGSFDAALSFQVIEHVEDDSRYVAEIRRVLASSGVLYLTTPNRLLRVAAGKKPWNQYHLREYTALDLEAVLRPAFAEVQIRGVRATDEVEQIEHERLREIRKMVALDPLNLRSCIPEPVKQWLGRFVERRKRGKDAAANQSGASDSFDQFGVSDYRASEGDLERSLDLLAVCRAH